ncbi:MAG: hypothetical protein QM648_07700 [Solirubrobacterales bacterium]
MPRRNTVMKLLGGVLYHVYNREADRSRMFFDDEDRRFFRELLRRHLGKEPMKDGRGRIYRSLRGRVRVAAFAVCWSHFHLIVFQIEPGGLDALMRSVMNAYTQYFRSKYGREKPMFVASYRARPLTSRKEKLTCIAYVNENHGDHCFCEFCSHGVYASDAGESPDWLDASSGLALFGGVGPYLELLDLRRRLRGLLAG